MLPCSDDLCSANLAVEAPLIEISALQEISFLHLAAGAQLCGGECNDADLAALDIADEGLRGQALAGGDVQAGIDHEDRLPRDQCG